LSIIIVANDVVPVVEAVTLSAWFSVERMVGGVDDNELLMSVLTAANGW